ncbi:MAG: hypothetical protein K6G88_11870 [Lachnospiraceae bacterium]|nr:hypothetical protein [Lachnospiraceae bacterium]
MKEKLKSKHEKFISEIRHKGKRVKSSCNDDEDYLHLPKLEDGSDESILLQKKLEAKFEELFGPFDED